MGNAAANKKDEVHPHTLDMLACGTDGCTVKITPPAPCAEGAVLPDALQRTAVLKLSKSAAHAARLDGNMRSSARILESIDPEHASTLAYVTCKQPLAIRTAAAIKSDKWLDAKAAAVAASTAAAPTAAAPTAAASTAAASTTAASRVMQDALDESAIFPTMLMEYGGVEISRAGFKTAAAAGCTCTLRAFIFAFRPVFTLVKKLAETRYVHGDIKPINMALMFAGGRPRIKLLDFDRLMTFSRFQAVLPLEEVYEYAAPEAMSIAMHSRNYDQFYVKTLQLNLDRIIGQQLADDLVEAFENSTGDYDEEQRIIKIIEMRLPDEAQHKAIVSIIHGEKSIDTCGLPKSFVVAVFQALRKDIIAGVNGMDTYGLGVSVVKSVLTALRFMKQKTTSSASPLGRFIRCLLFELGSPMMQQDPRRRVQAANLEQKFDAFMKAVDTIPGIDTVVDVDIFSAWARKHAISTK
jgi:hypothetical protein